MNLPHTGGETGVIMGFWNIRVWAVEVGCRGFPASSMASFLKEIGYQGAQKKKTLEAIGKEAIHYGKPVPLRNGGTNKFNWWRAKSRGVSFFASFQSNFSSVPILI